jgi:hypothetical protein
LPCPQTRDAAIIGLAGRYWRRINGNNKEELASWIHLGQSPVFSGRRAEGGSEHSSEKAKGEKS